MISKGKLFILLASSTSIISAAYIYSKQSYFDSETRAELRNALLAGKRNDLKNADIHFHRALQTTKSKFGPVSEQTFFILLELASHYRKNRMYQESYKIYRYILGEPGFTTRKLSEIHKAAGDVLLEAAGNEEALAHYKMALESASIEDKGPILEAMGVASVHTHDFEQALLYFKEALDLCIESNGSKSPDCKSLLTSIKNVQSVLQ